MSPEDFKRRRADMHYRNAAKVLGVSVDEVTPEQRQYAKLCAFGARSEEDALKLLEIGLRLGQLNANNEKTSRS